MDDPEFEQFQEFLSRSMSQMTGSVSDLIRAAMAAQVDGLIDARSRMMEAGWPDWMVSMALDSLVRGGTGASKLASLPPEGKK